MSLGRGERRQDRKVDRESLGVSFRALTRRIVRLGERALSRRHLRSLFAWCFN